MADGVRNNQQLQEIFNNESLQNGVLNQSSMLSDTTIGSLTSLFEPKMPRPLTLNVTQELRDWEDDAMKRKLGVVLYPVVKKFLTAKILQSERNLHRFGGEMNELRTSNERLTARVWDLVGKLVKAYEEIDLYKKRERVSEGKKQTAPVTTANGPKPQTVPAEDVLQALRSRWDVLCGAESAPNGNGEDLVSEAINIFDRSQHEDGKLNDLRQRVDGVDLLPAAIAKAAAFVDDSVNITNRIPLNVTAASPDFKQVAAVDDTYYDQDVSFGRARSKSAMENLERSGTGSITMTTNLREDLEKSALEGESCFYVDAKRSYAVPIELDSSDLQTVMHGACELGCVYFSEEHGDLRLTSNWHSHQRNASPESLMFCKSLPDFGDVIDIPALVASVGAKLQQSAEQKRIHEDKDIPADFLAPLAFIGIVDPTKTSVAISGDRVIFRQFEFPRGKHSLTLVKALHTNAPGTHAVDAKFAVAVMRLAVDILTKTVYSKNELRFDYKQLAERVVRWLRDAFQNVVVVCGQHSALCIANGSALIGDPNCKHHYFRSEEMSFEVHAWTF